MINVPLEASVDAPPCPACCVGKLAYPSTWWRDVLKLKRCTWCGHNEYDKILLAAFHEALAEVEVAR